MATEHYCADNPKGADWKPGASHACPHHDKQGRRQKPVRWGKNARAKLDREAGSVGVDRGTHISGTDSGR